MNTSRTSQLGLLMETQAKQFLEERNLKTIECNYHCKAGEIDLIMQYKQDIVFVEVRYRKTIHYGSAAESVDRNKQNKLRQAAEHYLQTNKLHCASRFDVIAITGSTSNPNIDWIKNAF